MYKLLAAALKQYFRDKEALFWSLAFPVIFLFVFRLFDFSGSANAHVILIDNAKNESSQVLVSVLQNVKGVGINTEFTDIDKAKKTLKNSETLDFKFLEENKDDKDKEKTEKEEKVTTNVVMVIPENFQIGNIEQGQNAPTIQLFYDQSSEGQASPSGIIQSIIDDATLGISGIQKPVQIEREGISIHEIVYFDVLMPGIIGMSVMQSAIIGIAASIAAFKEKRILKRLSATPLPTWKFLFVEVIARLITSTIQVTIIIVLSKIVFGVHIYGSVPLLYLFSIIGNFVFLNLGFVAAAVSKTSNAAQGLASAITTPMMFLSGVFFDRETLPKAAKVIADFLPLSPLLDALRGISLQGKGIMDLGSELLIIGVWTAITFVIAAKVFKFREE